MDKAFTIRWNIVGFAGGGAFVLSFLLGILSGNPFLTILLRAFLFGVVFALLGGGAALLVDRFIPQAAGGEDSPPGGGQRVPRGSNVDIVLDEGTPVGEDQIEELTLDEAEPAGGAAESEDGYDVSAAASFAGVDDDSLGSLDDESPDSSAGEDFAAEPVPPERSAARSGSGAADGLKTREEENNPAARNGIQEKPAGGPPDAIERDKNLAEGDLDVLPDMSSFESSFSPVTSSGTVTDTDSFESFGTDSLKRSGMDQDPETYVQAVRTILKRDEGKTK